LEEAVTLNIVQKKSQKVPLEQEPDHKSLPWLTSPQSLGRINQSATVLLPIHFAAMSRSYTVVDISRSGVRPKCLCQRLCPLCPGLKMAVP